MKFIVKIVILSVASVLSFSVLANSQCETVTTKQAIQAMNILTNELSSSALMVIDNFCETCNDEFPKPIVVESIEHVVLKPNTMSEIEVNSKVIDMAYIYVNGENLAKKIGCKTIAVSKNLD